MKKFVTVYLSSLISIFIFTSLIQYKLTLVDTFICALMTTGFIYFMRSLNK